MSEHDLTQPAQYDIPGLIVKMGSGKDIIAFAFAEF